MRVIERLESVYKDCTRWYHYKSRHAMRITKERSAARSISGDANPRHLAPRLEEAASFVSGAHDF